MRGLERIALVVALALSPGLAGAQQVSVGAGSSMDLGSGAIDLGCSDLTVAGTLSGGSVGFDQARDVTIDPTGVLNGGSAALRVAGDWDNSGTFNGDSSTVHLIDGCGLLSGTVAGSTTFASLDITTQSAKQVSFEAGGTTTVTGALDLHGQVGTLLKIRSTTGGIAAFLVSQGTASTNSVDIEDNDATGGNSILLGSNSVKGLNTPGWELAALVPLLTPLGYGALALVVFWAGRRRL